MKRIELELEKKNNSKLSGFEQKNSNEILLLNAPSEDLSILNRLGLDHTLNIVKKEQESISAITHLSKVYNKPVYLGEDIKDLCHKYDLRLIRAEAYKGKIDSKLASEINSFIKLAGENKISIGTSYENFFLLAPYEDFFSTSLKNKNNCTLFYREENYNQAQESQKFVKIYSWGENYSSLRRFRWLFADRCSTVESTSPCFTTIGFILISILIFGLIGSAFNQYLIAIIINLLLWNLKVLYNYGNLNDSCYEKSWNSQIKQIS